jgi:hypothetical protein
MAGKLIADPWWQETSVILGQIADTNRRERWPRRFARNIDTRIDARVLTDLTLG